MAWATAGSRNLVTPAQDPCPLKSMQRGPEHVLQVLREVERAGERAKVSEGRGADLEYLKTILLKMYETGESHAQPAVQWLAARRQSNH